MTITINVVITILVYAASLGIYRFWFSPVADVPGPVLAKISYWYEFYWDVIRKGRYVFHIRELHDRYGPIIRINPHEVHIDDPDFYEELYAGASTGRKRNKWSFNVDSFGLPDTLFAIKDHDKHRMRRTALNKFFSKTKIRALQKKIDQLSQKLLLRISEFRDSGESMPIGLAFTAFANDIASSYALDTREFHVDAPGFTPELHVAGEKAAKSSNFMKQFPWVITLIQKMPVSWVTALDPDLGVYMKFQIYLQKRTKEIKKSFDEPDYKPPEQTTVFHEILSSPHIPESEKRPSCLWQDAQTVVLAGTVTTATTLSTLFFFLLDDPQKLRRLRLEIFEAVPDKNATIDLNVLEKLPYLTACITEALRCISGVTARLPRIDPEKSIIFRAKTEGRGAPAAEDKTYVLPPGTPLSMTSMLIHYNARIYPEPHSFTPERWLENNSATGIDFIHHKLDKYFVPFGKGTRACLGINLAWAELYLVMATIWRRYGSEQVQMPGDDGYLELYDSSYERDIEIVGDGITPIVREPFKGIKVKVHPCDLD